MPTQSSLLSLLLTSTTLLQLGTTIPTFTDSTVVYLTNCQMSNGGTLFSEVSIYSDVTQSFNFQTPDAAEDTSLGLYTVWEGTTVTWFYAGNDPNQADAFAEFINPGAQDPNVPTFAQVGCATYTEGFADGGAIAVQFNCYKDKSRLLYTTSDHECDTVYYCRITEDACPFSPPGVATQLLEQSEEL